MTKRYEDPINHFIVDVSAYAQKLIEKHVGTRFVGDLYRFMNALGAKYAYVGRWDHSLRVHLTWPPQSKTQQRRS